MAEKRSWELEIRGGSQTHGGESEEAANVDCSVKMFQ